MIIKCGHVFHGACLKKFTYTKTCHNCDTLFDARQCRKLHLFDEVKDNSYGCTKPTYYYDWMYCDEKTVIKSIEFSKFGYRLGVDIDKNYVYVARAFVNNRILPAYYIPNKKVALATINECVLELKEDIDILDISRDDKELYGWQGVDGLNVPENAFDITQLPNEFCKDILDINANNGNEKLYIVREKRDGKTFYGKLCIKDDDKKIETFLAIDNAEDEINESDSLNIKVLVRNPA